MGVSVGKGSTPDYYTGQVGQGQESYYLDGETQGEPPGRWWGEGAAQFGLEGEVDAEVMHALYGNFLDPRDPRFHDPATRHEAARLGRAPGRYRTEDEIVLSRVAGAAGWSAEQVTALRSEAVPRRGQTEAEWLTDRIAEQAGLLPEQVKDIRQAARGQARQAVAYVDPTFSVPKSVTVLHTAYSRAEIDARRTGDEQAAARWASKRQAVESAIWSGNNAMLSHLNEKAGYVRVGRHGAGADRWTDARAWTVSSWFQHTSREGDPQLHIHNPILNKVVCPDGEVRTLDAQLIYRNKQGAGTIGERVMEEELTRTLGIRWAVRTDGTGREVVGVDQRAMDLFSQRSKNASKSLQVRLDAFRQHFDREPTALEMDRLKRQAVMFTGRAKKEQVYETTEQKLDRWDAKLRAEVAGGLSRVAQSVGTGQTDLPADEWSPTGVIAEAIAACQAARSTFSRSEVERQISLALPAYLGNLSAEQVRDTIDTLTDRALSEVEQVTQVTGEQPSYSLPEELRLGDGRSAYVKPTGPRYATVQHVIAEQALRRAAVERGRRGVPTGDVDKWLKTSTEGQTLGPDQAAAVRGLMTSGAAVSVLVGPAGTGKSHTVGVMSRGWQQMTGGRLVGLATSQIATEVLVEDGVEAMNTARWLAAQGRLEGGSIRPEDQRWKLTDRDVVVVDEASMVDTSVLEEIRARVDAAGARMVLTGDPRQLAAVGAGGAMAMLADGVAETHTLCEVRRFSAKWERSASLRLRDGDQSVIDEYDRRGRLIDSGTAEQAVLASARAYLGDTFNGKTSLVVAPTNEMAAAVSAAIRNQLVALGRVAPGSVILGKDGNECGTGDLVMARRNEWEVGVTNRRRYVVQEVATDGSMVVQVEGQAEARRLPADYVQEHLTLAYAGTIHAVEGLTVDTSRGIVTGQMSPEALYVLLTRGRENNTAHVVTQAETPDEATGQTHDRERMPATTVIADILAREDDAEQAALDQRAEDARNARSMYTIHAQYEVASQRICRIRTDQWLDRLTAEGTLSEQDRQRLAADQGTEQLARQLRAVEQAGHDPVSALRAAVGDYSLETARSVAQVLQHRISDQHPDAMRPHVELLGDVAPADVPEPWRQHLAELADAAADRRRELGTQVAQEAPAWAVDALGPVPDDVVARAEWEHRAGIVAAYREATPAVTDDPRVIGPAPGTSAPERRAAWHSAWTALGRPEAGVEEQDLSEGALRVRVKAWERELQWAPPNVDQEMRATGQTVARYEQEAAILRARAETVADASERAALEQEAADKQALAQSMREVEAHLAETAEQRAAWYVETAVTRELADRARSALAAQGRDISAEPDRVTAEEWLQVHEEAMRAEDPYRLITEDDVRDEGYDEQDQTDGMEFVEVKFSEKVESAAEDREMPAGVPAPAEAEAAAVAARLAAEEIADRRSAEAAHAEATAQAESAAAEAQEREQAWRREDELVQREAAESRQDELAY
jgi:conjugative relaxase-like TrwC/TraI family protein